MVTAPASLAASAQLSARHLVKDAQETPRLSSLRHGQAAAELEPSPGLHSPVLGTLVVLISLVEMKLSAFSN